MGKATFASLVIAKLKSAVGTDGATYTADTPDKAQTAIAEAITEYLIANAVITISYSGTLTTDTGTDPTITDTMKITGTCAKIGKPSDFIAWVNKIQSVIASSFSVVSPGASGVITTFKPFSPAINALQISQSDLYNAYKNNVSAPMQSVWEVICGKILDWLNSPNGKNPTATALPATRTGVSAGTASLVSITIS